MKRATDRQSVHFLKVEVVFYIRSFAVPLLTYTTNSHEVMTLRTARREVEVSLTALVEFCVVKFVEIRPSL